MKTTGKAGAESSDQAAPGPLTTPTQNRLMGSTMAQSSEDFSPGPAFPALGTHPGRKAPDKPGETIKIPYPGGPVSHNPRKTMPRPPQGPAAQMKTAAASLEVFVKPGNGRLRGAAARPKRSDQGPLPSEADVYPDDSVADVVSEKHSTVSPGARADSRTPRNRGNTNTSMAFSSPRHTPRDRRGTIDRRASVSSAKQSGFTPEQTPQSNRALTATVMPVEVAPLGTGRPTQGVTQLESNAMLQAVTADPPINMNFEPPPGMTELGTPSMNLLTAFSQLAQHCAQASAQQAHYYSQLSAIQEETGPSPTTAFFPAPPGFANIGGGPLAPAHQQTISAPPTAFPVFSGAPVPMNSMAGFYAAAPNPVPIPDGISDIQKISPLSTSFDEVGTPQTGPGPARQPPAPRFPVGNTYYRGLGQKMTALRPKPNGLAPDQLDGSRYGIEMGGVGLQCTGFVWSPPRPDRSTALGRMGYLWGQP